MHWEFYKFSQKRGNNQRTKHTQNSVSVNLNAASRKYQVQKLAETNRRWRKEVKSTLIAKGHQTYGKLTGGICYIISLFRFAYLCVDTGTYFPEFCGLDWGFFWPLQRFA